MEDAGNGGDSRSYHVTFERIRRVLGFRPHYTVDDAIGEVRDLFVTGEIPDLANPRFHNARWLERNGQALGVT